MKKYIDISIIVSAFAVAIVLCSCGTQMLTSVSYVDDDLYAINNRRAVVVESKQTTAVSQVPKATTSDLSEIDDILGDIPSSDEDDDNLLVEDYDSAYQRRLKGQSSLSYNTPSSYTNYLLSDSYYATLTYDPSYYNVMVMGDEIWVEPKYVTSLFGSWGVPLWTYGSPFYRDWYYWYTPYYSWYYDWYWGRPYWYSGWYGGWYGFYPWHHHPIYGYPAPGRPWHRPGYADVRRPSSVVRPGTSGMRPAREYSYGSRNGATTGTYRRNNSSQGIRNNNYYDNGSVSTPSRGQNDNISTPSMNNGSGASIRGGGVSRDVRRGTQNNNNSSINRERNSSSQESIRRSYSNPSSRSGFSSGGTTRRSSYSGGYSGSSSRGGSYSSGGAARRR